MRYYFHIQRDGVLILDHEGLELDGIQDVSREAIESAREIIAERLRHGRSLSGEDAFQVMDQGGTVVFELRFSSVISNLFRYPAS